MLQLKFVTTLLFSSDRSCHLLAEAAPQLRFLSARADGISDDGVASLARLGISSGSIESDSQPDSASRGGLRTLLLDLATARLTSGGLAALAGATALEKLSIAYQAQPSQRVGSASATTKCSVAFGSCDTTVWRRWRPRRRCTTYPGTAATPGEVLFVLPSKFSSSALKFF